MQIVPYFYFNGNAKEAIDFYKKAFSAPDPSIMLYKEQPSPDLPKEFEDMIMHAELITKAGSFYISDAFGEGKVKIGNNVQVNLNCDSEEEIKFLFNHLAEDGQIEMKLEDTFWGALFGSLTDKFGISWSLNFQRNQM